MKIGDNGGGVAIIINTKNWRRDQKLRFGLYQSWMWDKDLTDRMFQCTNVLADKQTKYTHWQALLKYYYNKVGNQLWRVLFFQTCSDSNSKIKNSGGHLICYTEWGSEWTDINPKHTWNI